MQASDPSWFETPASRPPHHEGSCIASFGSGTRMTELTYPVIIEPLADADGGGFLASVPDLPGCMSDGATPEEALANVRSAIEDWLDTARELGRELPQPSRRMTLSMRPQNGAIRRRPGEPSTRAGTGRTGMTKDIDRRQFGLGLAAGTLALAAGAPARAAGPLKIRVGWVVAPSSLAPLIEAKRDILKHV
eukprot:gene29444-33086_t